MKWSQGSQPSKHPAPRLPIFTMGFKTLPETVKKMACSSLVGSEAGAGGQSRGLLGSPDRQESRWEQEERLWAECRSGSP